MSRIIKTSVLVVVSHLMLATYVPLDAQSVQVIFDTDITGDVDDVLALAMLHTLSDQGDCQLLGVTVSKDHPLTAPFVDAVNTFYGRPDIPVGIPINAPKRESKYLGLVEQKDANGKYIYPHDVGVTKQPEQAVPLLRKLLSAADNHSIVIIQVGLATNLAQLLETPGDQYSDLSGPELVAQKVKFLSVMAGSFQTIYDGNRYTESNVINDIPVMQVLADQWPDEVPIIWSGFEIGIAVTYPHESVARDFEYIKHHIVKESYLLHSGPDHDRPTWDLTSVLYAIFPDRDYFDLSTPGRVLVESDGFTRFTPVWKRVNDPERLKNASPESSRDRFLKMNMSQAEQVKEALIQLVSKPPQSHK